MALSYKKEDQWSNDYRFPVDGQAFKLRFGVAGHVFTEDNSRRKKAADGHDKEDREPQPYPLLIVYGTPVNPKTGKAIPGEKEIMGRYRMAYDFTKFVPAKVTEGDLEQLAAKVKLSDFQNDDITLYPTAATAKGVKTGFQKKMEATYFIEKLAQYLGDIEKLNELDGIICNFTTYTISGEGKINRRTGEEVKDRDISIPGRIFKGPGGKDAVEGEDDGEGEGEEEPEEKPAKKPGKSTKPAEDEEEEEEPVKKPGKKTAPKEDEEEEEEPKKKPAGKKAAAKDDGDDDESQAKDIVKQAFEFVGSDDATAITRKAKRLLSLAEDAGDGVADFIDNAKWVKKVIAELGE